MNRLLLCCGLALMTALFAPGVAQAQVVLVGGTRGLSSPATNSLLVNIDLTTGAASAPRDTGIRFVAGIATQPISGFLFGLTTSVSSPPNSLVRFDVTNGNSTLVGSTGLPLVVEGDLAFNPLNGFLYGLQDGGISGTQRNFFRIDPISGNAMTIASLASPAADFSALVFNHTGTLFAIDSAGTSNSLLQVMDPASGAIMSTLAMNVDLGSAVGMAFHPITGVAYVSDGGLIGASTGLLYTLDTLTGILTPIGPTGIPEGIAGLAFVSIPEPSSLALCGLCTVVVWLYRRAIDGNAELSAAKE